MPIGTSIVCRVSYLCLTKEYAAKPKYTTAQYIELSVYVLSTGIVCANRFRFSITAFKI